MYIYNQKFDNHKTIRICIQQPYSTDITITQIPEYPGALVTDGVDDYGLVENLSSGVKMLFMTVNPIGDFNVGKAYYAQSNISRSFWVISIRDTITYNSKTLMV